MLKKLKFPSIIKTSAGNVSFPVKQLLALLTCFIILALASLNLRRQFPSQSSHILLIQSSLFIVTNWRMMFAARAYAVNRNRMEFACYGIWFLVMMLFAVAGLLTVTDVEAELFGMDAARAYTLFPIVIFAPDVVRGLIHPVGNPLVHSLKNGRNTPMQAKAGEDYDGRETVSKLPPGLMMSDATFAKRTLDFGMFLGKANVARDWRVSSGRATYFINAACDGTATHAKWDIVVSLKRLENEISVRFNPKHFKKIFRANPTTDLVEELIKRLSESFKHHSYSNEVGAKEALIGQGRLHAAKRTMLKDFWKTFAILAASVSVIIFISYLQLTQQKLPFRFKSYSAAALRLAASQTTNGALGAKIHEPDGNLHETAASVVLLNAFDSLDAIDTEKTARFIGSFQKPDGAICAGTPCLWSETFLPLKALSILKKLDAIDRDKLIVGLASFQSDSGWFMPNQGETLFPYEFTHQCLAALALLGALDRVDFEGAWNKYFDAQPAPIRELPWHLFDLSRILGRKDKNLEKIIVDDYEKESVASGSWWVKNHGTYYDAQISAAHELDAVLYFGPEEEINLKSFKRRLQPLYYEHGVHSIADIHHQLIAYKKLVEIENRRHPEAQTIKSISEFLSILFLASVILQTIFCASEMRRLNSIVKKEAV